MKDTLTVRYYARPDGRMSEIEMSNIFKEDVDFFVKNNIVVSIEELMTGDIVVYGCPRYDDSEESEIIVFSDNRNCQDTMKNLREKCEKEFL
jgi:coenzyme F420-reducing hydrogenase gamma subunit